MSSHVKRTLKIVTIDQQSKYLKKVKELWRKNSDKLGFFPNGAFSEYAAKRNIQVALFNDRCVGYLLYRKSKDRIIIVHLCVAPDNRKMGIAKALVDHLKKNTASYLGIGLLCRRDYQEANKIWQKLNFVAKDEKLGRGKSKETLTFWWYDHGHDNLFSILDEKETRAKLKTAIDANIFFDLFTNISKDNIDSIDSHALLAPWLRESIAICITDEMYNEIYRNSSGEKRERQRQYADTFPVLNASSNAAFEVTYKKLKSFFPHNLKESDISDIRHLTHSILEGAPFFATFDEKLLKKSRTINKEFGVQILRPGELIIHLDELIREAEYNPIRLAGSLVLISLIKATQVRECINNFLCFRKGERKKDFHKLMNLYLSDPNNFETLLVRDDKDNLLALIVHDKQDRNILNIPIFRIAKNALSKTLVRHLSFKSLQIACDENRLITKVSDRFITSDIIEALEDNSFIKFEREWVKFNLYATGKTSEIINKLSFFIAIYPSATKYLNELKKTITYSDNKQETLTLCSVEKLLWPAKTTDSNIPSYIIPIAPKWAAHLFDEQLAKQMLFGSVPQLAMSFENVYYRARRPYVISAPARILWYVSYDKNYIGSKHIRACSYIKECFEGTPKMLYRQFRRLGIYKWRDVINIVNGDINKEMMAILFSHTESFHNPIHWNELQGILFAFEGKRSQIQSPTRISNKCFEKLYKTGVTRRENCCQTKY